MADDNYLRASNGSGEAVMSVVTADRPPLSATLIVDSVLNWPVRGIATSGTLIPDEGLIDPDTASVFKYHLDGTIIMIDEFAPGYNDVGNSEDQVVVIKPTTLWADLVSENDGGGASVVIGPTPPPDPEEGDLWGDTSDEGLNELVVAVGALLMPVGFIYFSHNSANPATYLGFGTWTAIADRIIIGVGSDPDWDAAGDTFGAKDVTLTTAQMPVHTHNFRYAASLSGGGINSLYGMPYNAASNASLYTQIGEPPTASGETRNGVLNAGSGAAHNNMPPVIAEYIWRRTA